MFVVVFVHQDLGVVYGDAHDGGGDVPADVPFFLSLFFLQKSKFLRGKAADDQLISLIYKNNYTPPEMSKEREDSLTIINDSPISDWLDSPQFEKAAEAQEQQYSKQQQQEQNGNPI